MQPIIKRLYRANTLFIFLAALATLVLIYFSLKPPSTDPNPWPWWPNDKVLHFTSYFVLCVLYILSFMKKKEVFKWAVFGAFALGLALELLQSVPYFQRTFDLYDLAANGFGILTAYLLLKYGLNWNAN